MAWQHINMKGRFEFYSNQQNIDLSKITADLVKDFKIDLPLETQVH